MFLSIFLIFFSSLFLILSFPLPDFSLLAWVGLIPLFFALENKSKKQAFWLSYLWGLFFWAGLIYWLVKVTLLGYVFLVLYLAVYFALFGLIVSVFGFRLAVSGMIFIPAVWVSLEFLRTHLFTGFPWAILGYSQYKNLPIIQIADITGAYGLSFLIVLVNMTISQTIKAIHRRKILFSGYWLLVSGFFVATCFIYGQIKLHQPSAISYQPSAISYQPSAKVSLIQANISPYEKWDEHFKELILEKYSLMSQITAQENPHLIIWPETSFPGFWEEEPVLSEEVLNLVKELNMYILFGVPTLENDSSYNCAILISPLRGEIKRYRKIHLVPFGEYIPFAKIFRFLENKFAIGDYVGGKEHTIFQIRNPSRQSRDPDISGKSDGSTTLTIGTEQSRSAEIRNKFEIQNSKFEISGYNFSVLICFEDIFPDLVRRFVQNGAEFLINITEDGWYGKTGASFQHSQAAVFRAIENRRYVVRVANTGYSCIISSQGKIVSELKDKQGNKLFIAGVHAGEVIPNSQKTIYAYWGDWFAWGCTVIVLLMALSLIKSPVKKYT